MYLRHSSSCIHAGPNPHDFLQKQTTARLSWWGRTHTQKTNCVFYLCTHPRSLNPHLLCLPCRWHIDKFYSPVTCPQQLNACTVGANYYNNVFSMYRISMPQNNFSLPNLSTANKSVFCARILSTTTVFAYLQAPCPQPLNLQYRISVFLRSQSPKTKSILCPLTPSWQVLRRRFLNLHNPQAHHKH